MFYKGYFIVFFMKKEIKVYLQAPLSTSDSLYYKNLLKYPPKNVNYETNISSSGIITSKRKLFLNNFLKNNLRKIAGIFNLPILNIHKTPETDASVIHCVDPI